MPVAQTVQSPSNIPLQLSRGDDQGTILGFGTTPGMGIPDKIAFFGATPVAPITPAGYATLQTAGSTTALYATSATTGGIGTTQYTFGDIIATLKTLGLFKS
jgi:hypothetical protein